MIFVTLIQIFRVCHCSNPASLLRVRILVAQLQRLANQIHLLIQFLTTTQPLAATSMTTMKCVWSIQTDGQRPLSPLPVQSESTKISIKDSLSTPG